MDASLRAHLFPCKHRNSCRHRLLPPLSTRFICIYIGDRGLHPHRHRRLCLLPTQRKNQPFWPPPPTPMNYNNQQYPPVGVPPPQGLFVLLLSYFLPLFLFCLLVETNTNVLCRTTFFFRLSAGGVPSEGRLPPTGIPGTGVPCTAVPAAAAPAPAGPFLS